MSLLREKYDDYYFAVNPSFPQKIRAKANIVKSFKKRGDLLEIGCGDAFLLNELKGNFNAVGIDISEHALMRAQKLIDKRKLKIMDIEKEDLKGKYDVILAFDVLEHLKNPKKAIIKVKKALKNRGIFIFSVPNNHGLFGSISTMVFNYFDKTHMSTFKRGEWIRIVNDLGFKELEIINKTWFGFTKFDLAKYFTTTFIVKVKVS